MSGDDVAMRERFARVADTTDDADWDGVVSRAGFVPEERRSVRRRVALAALTAFALGVAVTVALAMPFRAESGGQVAPGPKRAERVVESGTIGWLYRHEPRGRSVERAGLAVGSLTGSHWQPVRFARVIVPDPANGAKVAISLIGERGRNICMTVFIGRASFGGFGGCAIKELLRPLSVMTGGGFDLAGGPGGVILAGLASDDVARLELFLPNDRRRAVPLKDNAFVVQLPEGESFSRLVAYDRNGLVIGTDPTEPPVRLPG